MARRRSIIPGVDVRRASPSRLTLLVVAAGAVALIGLVLSHWFARVGLDLAWTAGAVCALAGLLAARQTAGPSTRATWTWLSLAALSWLLGQLAWDAFALIGSPPSPNLADAGWWGFAVLVIA